MSGTQGFPDKTPVVVDEKGILEKIDNETGMVVERIIVQNGNIIQHDYFEDGQLIKSDTHGGDE